LRELLVTAGGVVKKLCKKNLPTLNATKL